MSNELTGRRVTVVVPTFREVENIPILLDRLARVRRDTGLQLDVLIMDDDSRDGSVEVVQQRGEPWVQLIVRTTDRGLSAAVLDGMRRATGDVLVCMDADLSHPPESVPDLLRALDDGADFVIGSRYVEGGSTSDDWGLFRWLNSRVATLLARPFTNARDPMAGFFAIRRSSFERGRELNPIGYKIGLELLVKCGCERVVEKPIHFEDRIHGESKLTLRQQLLYLQHLRRLFIFKFGVWSHLLQFLVVGALGTLVNLAVVTALLWAGLTARPSILAGIGVSVCFNFVLNRRFSFSYARHGSWLRQAVGFVAASSIGAAINYAVAVAALGIRADLPPQVAALFGIAAGTAFNFVANRYLVFRTKHVRTPAPR
ncbi:MAG: hypothetical protein A2138_25705 [Deltaproteobacteria bacterium RBG_16_71_12]|nr:MAG: hypothetical protein A2138_25705 [Deltaproteobacteria bacterium RBG_16_71_12]